ncbi:hypothetical protein XELAEV_18025972mg [Xenopus laevis]|uniref:Uncharacterized protein n=1 Tax=Xenopus laevis TaxID=8355 RepID=A0A974D3C3_XENLA|nr:hypothetical protein XELAEV_18025972mg [Xenopus laevis]
MGRRLDRDQAISPWREIKYALVIRSFIGAQSAASRNCLHQILFYLSSTRVSENKHYALQGTPSITRSPEFCLLFICLAILHYVGWEVVTIEMKMAFVTTWPTIHNLPLTPTDLWSEIKMVFLRSPIIHMLLPCWLTGFWSELPNHWHSNAKNQCNLAIQMRAQNTERPSIQHKQSTFG